MGIGAFRVEIDGINITGPQSTLVSVLVSCHGAARGFRPGAYEQRIPGTVTRALAAISRAGEDMSLAHGKECAGMPKTRSDTTCPAGRSPERPQVVRDVVRDADRAALPDASGLLPDGLPRCVVEA
jgi:hypothetical protein